MCELHLHPAPSQPGSSSSPSGSSETFTLGRRSFMRVAGLGAGAAIVVAVGTRPSSASYLDSSGTATALMLSCMDYRLTDSVFEYMNSRGLDHDYDHVILAGAAIGATNAAFSDWHATFWQHLDAAIALHQIKEVMVIDHRDCGAAVLALGAQAVDTPEKETAAHTAAIAELGRQIKDKHPTLGFSGYLMALDGTVETIQE